MTLRFESHDAGLPLALNIVQLHKGNIAIHTREGERTDLLITLPVAGPHLLSAERTPAAEAGWSHRP